MLRLQLHLSEKKKNAMIDINNRRWIACDIERDIA